VHTLVVSDLHLGLRSGRDRLRERSARARLLETLAGVRRLVLLGDTLELREGPVWEALGAALPVLGELGAALGPKGEVLLLIGNHDYHLLDPWLARRAERAAPPPLGLEAEVDWREGEPLAALARALAPARVRVAYPGAWLAPGVYATHGHYLDAETTLPTFERLGAGVMARLLRRPLPRAAAAEDYEALLAPLYAWLHASAQRRLEQSGFDSNGATLRAWTRLRGDDRRRDLRARALRAALPLAVAALNRAGLGPLRADLGSAALRDASLAAFARTLERLRVEAAQVIFGHTHRAGPLPGDPPARWRTQAGGALINAGSWVHEPAFLGRDPRASPYRPGFAVRLDGGGAASPELINLLD
jgi:UDP-2,3-diacylglucosamine pyrophosphatase LpxH